MNAPGSQSLSEELRHHLPGGATVLFTDRSHGSFALPGRPGADVAGAEAAAAGVVPAAEQRERVLALTGATKLARGRQVHGSTVTRIDTADTPPVDPAAGGARTPRIAGFAPPAEADGQASSLTGLAVMVVSADCLPVAVAGNGALAMLHCGWRGLAAGVLEQGVRAVGELAGPGPLSAVIGPGAGPCCYEVGPVVHEALGVPRQSALLDLAGVARARLLASGVGEVRTVRRCTICDERFYSHRREGARAGRQAGIAWLS